MYEQIAANKRRTAILIAGFVLLIAAVAIAFNYAVLKGGWPGVVVGVHLRRPPHVRVLLELGQGRPGRQPGQAR